MIHKKLPNLTINLQKHDLLFNLRLKIFPHLIVMKWHENLPYLLNTHDETYERLEKLNDDSESVNNSDEVNRMNPDLDICLLMKSRERIFLRDQGKTAQLDFEAAGNQWNLKSYHVVKLFKPKYLNAAYNQFSKSSISIYF